MRDNRSDHRTAIRERAVEIGFDAAGFTLLRESDHTSFLREWLESGRYGEMRWLARPDAVEARADPRSRWPDLRSAIVVTMNYGPGDDDDADVSRAIIARYARGRDYHRVLKQRLLTLLREVEQIVGRRLPAARAYVDTGPLLERELAARAGLGWFGRNTMLIHPRRGSYFFVGVLLTELELEGDMPAVHDHCGTCNACVGACPTDALLGRDANGAPVIDATRCISYLTIEHKGPVPEELRKPTGNRVFGCDICQEVCPWNAPKFVQVTSEPAFAPRPAGPHAQAGGQAQSGDGETGAGEVRTLPGTGSPSLIDLMRMERDEWDLWTRGSAIRRAGYAGLKRNVAVAMGNWLEADEDRADAAVPTLRRALDDPEPLVREHTAWALGRARTATARVTLEERLSIETDPAVRTAIEAAVAHSESAK